MIKTIQLFLVCYCFLFGSSAFSQVIVNGVDINKLDIKYCSINEYSGSKGEIIYIDYGQERLERREPNQIQDNTGKVITFKSQMDLLNYMDKNGWQYVNSWLEVAASASSITLYKKKQE